MWEYIILLHVVLCIRSTRISPRFFSQVCDDGHIGINNFAFPVGCCTILTHLIDTILPFILSIALLVSNLFRDSVSVFIRWAHGHQPLYLCLSFIPYFTFGAAQNKYSNDYSVTKLLFRVDTVEDCSFCNRILTYLCVRMRVRVHLSVCMCVYECVCAFERLWVGVCADVCVYVCIRACVCVEDTLVYQQYITLRCARGHP